MSQRTPGSLEDVIVQWLNEKAETLEAVFFALVGPVVQHPYFAVAVLVAVVYLVLARKGKRRK